VALHITVHFGLFSTAVNTTFLLIIFTEGMKMNCVISCHIVLLKQASMVK
jgi:hypothetical protein